MSKVCVEIEIDTETGDLSVYECAPKEPMEGEPAGETFQDIDSALQAAAAILTGERSETNELQDAMAGGYDKVRGAGAMGGKPAGLQYAEE